MKKRKLDIRLIVGIILVLVIVIGVFSIINKSDKPAGSDTLSVTYGGEVLAKYTIDQLKSMDSVQFEKKILSSDGSTEEGLFKGVAVSTVLKQTDPQLLQKGTKVVSKATDTFTSAYTMDEVTAPENVVVIYEKDGKALAGMSDGGSGPLRIVVKDDTYGNRSTKFLCQLNVE